MTTATVTLDPLGALLRVMAEDILDDVDRNEQLCAQQRDEALRRWPHDHEMQREMERYVAWQARCRETRVRVANELLAAATAPTLAAKLERWEAVVSLSPGLKHSEAGQFFDDARVLMADEDCRRLFADFALNRSPAPASDASLRERFDHAERALAGAVFVVAPVASPRAVAPRRDCKRQPRPRSRRRRPRVRARGPDDGSDPEPPPPSWLGAAA